MSKQYLTAHTIDAAHPTDIFALAATPTSLLTGSGASALKVFSTDPDGSGALEPAEAQTLAGAHPTGVHHLAAASRADVAVSAGFAGEARVWRRPVVEQPAAAWREAGRLVVPRGSGGGGSSSATAVASSSAAAAAPPAEGARRGGGAAVGDVWAVAVSARGEYAAASAADGRVRVWDLRGGAEGPAEMPVVREYETRGSFGMCVDMSADGKFVASGHESGSVFVFDNDAGRLLHSLAGLVKPVRAVAFTPLAKILAAAGDARVIALYDVRSGEQIALLSGHSSWITALHFSDSGEWLLSGAYDGKAKVWGMETRSCVATHGESDKAIWCARWLPKITRTEMFVLAGENRSISFYREASGG